MKTLGAVCAVVATVAMSAGARAALSDAEAGQLTSKYHCQACHAIDKKLVGPSFKDVAKKYAGDKSAQQKLEQKVKNGGSGAWGPIPMPPNNVPEADLDQMVAWVLGLK